MIRPFALPLGLLLIIGACAPEAGPRATTAAPSARSIPVAPVTWQERLVADAQQVQAQLSFWPLVPTYAPVEVGVQVRTRDYGCGVSTSPCLDYRFESVPATVVLQVLQGTAGCCLDAARPGALRNVDIRPGVRAQYDVEPPQFGGPILWWVEDTARGSVYVALNSPVFSEDELIRIASSMRPLPASTSTPSTAPATTAVPLCGPGQFPVLDIAFPPPPGDAPGSGAASAEAAFRRTFPDLTSYSISYPFGQGPSAPAWIAAGGRAYVAQILGPASGNNWFAYQARFLGCRSLSAPGVAIQVCGTVSAYAADGAHMLLTLTTDTANVQLNLQYQFASGPFPTDIGDRLTAKENQLVRVSGVRGLPDTGSPGATVLRDFSIERMTACP